ncbi:MAM domain [Parelaphostrongylus tenuis]|uniref:MAM domain n=1 Tax=Parelaphostrongylus tenuis TaxID=148309 RepID=A0AAD5N987_PARTN|nr:MAM domain [Parelaphostrongylus tenuis]
MERNTSQYTSNSIVSRILQLALGLFVTTSDLPSYASNLEHLTYDCSFDSECRFVQQLLMLPRIRL